MRARATVAEVSEVINGAAVWQVNWRVEVDCFQLSSCHQVQFQPCQRDANYSRRQISAPPSPASPLAEPVQPRDHPSALKPRSAPFPSPTEPAKAIPPSPPMTKEPLAAQIWPSPAITTTTTSPPPPNPEPSLSIVHRRPNSVPSCKNTRLGRAGRRPLGCAMRGQARRARRAADPAVQERAAAFAAAQVATARGAGTGSGKQHIYSREQLLSLRPQGHTSLCIAALHFTPRSERYSCYARAVRLGLADSGPPCPHAYESVPSAAARDMLARVHALSVGRHPRSHSRT